MSGAEPALVAAMGVDAALAGTALGAGTAAAAPALAGTALGAGGVAASPMAASALNGSIMGTMAPGAAPLGSGMFGLNAPMAFEAVSGPQASLMSLGSGMHGIAMPTAAAPAWYEGAKAGLMSGAKNLNAVAPAMNMMNQQPQMQAPQGRPIFQGEAAPIAQPMPTPRNLLVQRMAMQNGLLR